MGLGLPSLSASLDTTTSDTSSIGAYTNTGFSGSNSPIVSYAPPSSYSIPEYGQTTDTPTAYQPVSGTFSVAGASVSTTIPTPYIVAAAVILFLLVK
jgi:hypothetical protein